MNLGIRRASISDAAELVELAGRTFREAFAADNTPADIADHIARSYGMQQQTREISDPGIVTLLAWADEELIGFAQLRSESTPSCVTGERPIELWRFYLSQTRYGQGVAQTLMGRVMMEARQADARTIWLAVWERNERAKSFYRKCGFADVGAQTFMLGQDAQTDRIMMQPVG